MYGEVGKTHFISFSWVVFLKKTLFYTKDNLCFLSYALATSFAKIVASLYGKNIKLVHKGV